MASLFTLGIAIWILVSVVMYMNRHPLLIWKKYTYYERGNLKTLKEIHLVGRGYLYTYRENGSLLKKEYMHFLSIQEAGYELYYPSGQLKYKEDEI